MKEAEDILDEQEESFFHELGILLRYMKEAFLRRLKSPLWRFIFGQKDFEEPEDDYEDDEEEEVSEEPASDTPDASPEPEAPAPPRRKARSNLIQVIQNYQEKFQKKQDRRNRRKNVHARKIRKKQETQNDAQLEFKFEETPVESAPEPVPEPVLPIQSENYQLPPLSLLKIVEENHSVDQQEIEEKKEKILNCLDSFRLDVQMGEAIRGPRVTMFCVKVADGVRVEEVTKYERNLAMTVEAESLRVLAPVPKHDYVGIEVPNRKADPVTLGNIMQGPAWQQTDAKVPLVLGKNIEGKDIVMDLAPAPHMLVAGATGSGKSVLLNTIITSLICRFKPEELRLMLVDPKVVEMMPYNTLPHLLVPVIAESQYIMLALKWLCWEMERRYQLLARVGARNIHEYNHRNLPPEPVLDDLGAPIPEKLPYIVLIVDELADIILTSDKNEVSNYLQRLGQKARAAGIHTILATQRPSVNVVTGTIKANLPVRCAFKVSSNIDSRTILDHKGAEALLGRGDMLYRSEKGDVQRLQGAMVTDEEIKRIVDFCAAQGNAPKTFDAIQDGEKLTGETDNSNANSGELSEDDLKLLRQAAEIVVSERKPTISYIQRKLGVGYNKAATLIELLEKYGVLGPSTGPNKPREILIDTIEEIKF
ncbi:MAG: DNA translocase FtsK [Victivallales bacterium]|nr:DNA translocase FtsK [Victivallales bacterium]